MSHVNAKVGMQEVTGFSIVNCKSANLMRTDKKGNSAKQIGQKESYFSRKTILIPTHILSQENNIHAK